MPGVSVRDKRRLPFFIVEKPATKAIRDGIGGRRGQVALAIYAGILECANDVRGGDTFEMPRREIATKAMVTPELLRQYVPELERVGVLHAVDQSAEGKPTLWTLLTPPDAEGVGSAPTPGVSAAPNGGVGPAPTPLESEGVGPDTTGGVGSAPPALKKGSQEGKKEKVALPSGNATSPENQPTESLGSRREIVDLSHRLANEVLERDGKAKVNPDDERTWLKPLRDLVDLDGRTVEEVAAVIDWLATDDFNGQTVLSPTKLRARFTELAVKAGVATPAAGEPSALDIGFRRSGRRQAESELPAGWLAAHPATPELDAEWEPVAAYLRKRVDESTYNIWLRGLHLHEAGDELVIGCDGHAKGFLRDRFGRLIESAAGKPYKLVVCGCDRKRAAA